MSASRVLVYGGRGALGSAVVDYFKSKSWWVLSVDLLANEQADANVVLSSTESWEGQGQEVDGKVDDILHDDKLDAVVCVAGGWAGGNAASKQFVVNCDLMWKQSVWTSVLASRLASRHLSSGGVLVLTGAKPALGPTPGMIGYGMAKAAVHQLVSSLSQQNSGLPANATVLGILPVTLDTPANRKAMPNADFSTWTPLPLVAEYFFTWSSSSHEQRPTSGSLLQLITANGETTLTPTQT